MGAGILALDTRLQNLEQRAMFLCAQALGVRRERAPLLSRARRDLRRASAAFAAVAVLLRQRGSHGHADWADLRAASADWHARWVEHQLAAL